jgi:glycosyltransferase involved in cell wall biosynthesis
VSSAPLVSVAIPAFNPRFFHAALQSVLSQSYESLEIIICDDSPGDEIASIVEGVSAQTRFPLRYLKNPQPLGFAGNLLRCLEESRGEYIKFLCDDDRLFSGCIATQAALLSEYEDVSLVGAQRYLCDADDHILPHRLENTAMAGGNALFKGGDLLDFFEVRPLNFIGGLSNVLMRTADVRELLPALLQPEVGFAGLLDLVLFVCLLRRGNLAVASQVQSVERLHPDSFKCQAAVQQQMLVEGQWLTQMLNERGDKGTAFSGWIRYCAALPGVDAKNRVWEEFSLGHLLVARQAVQESRVGSDSRSFGQLYAQWLECRREPAILGQLLAQTHAWPRRPTIVPIVIDGAGDRQALELTLESINAQCYGAQAVVVLSSAGAQAGLDGRVLNLVLEADWAQQLNGVLPQLEGADWFYLLRAGDRLTEAALLLMAERIVERQHMLCCYADEGALVDGISREPVFKPDFNLDLMRSYPYTGRALAFERNGFLARGGFSADFQELAPQDLLWRMVESAGPHTIEHIGEVLVESSFSYASWLSSTAVAAENPRLLEAHLQRLGVAFDWRAGSEALINQVDYRHARQPLVSIIISTKDQLTALERCLASLLEKTAYPNYEVLIVDNASLTSEARAWLDGMAQLGSDKLRVLRYPHAANFAAIHNFAAAQARGDYLLMLTPNSVITDADWLDALMSQAQRPEVGIVGAKMVCAQGTLQHAGLVLGLRGPVGAPFIGESMQSGGYMQRLQVVQNYSAVSDDCLLVRKQVFEELGGLDERSFSLAFNDVDLGLRVAKAGYLVVWTPHARLMLVEPAVSLQQGGEQARQEQLGREQQTIYRKWLPDMARDPAYNPNLSLTGSSFCLEPGMRLGWSPFGSRSLPRVLALPVNQSAVGHYRVVQPFLELEAAGLVTGVQAFEMPSIIELERQSPDTVVMQGRYNDALVNEIERVKTYSRALRIFELDDYIIDVPEKNGHLKHRPKDFEKAMRRGISLCDRVVVSTQALADALNGMHHDIRVVPNTLATHLWSNRVSLRRTGAKPRVGWGGGTSHAGDLEIIADVVRELADVVDWVFFGMCPQALLPYVREFHPSVGLQEYPAKLASLNLDLALAPLEYHIFNDCKSNLRLLEYGACGYPVICTDTEAYRGYLPCTRVVSNSTEEWLQAIRMHLADPEASYRMGDELREAVMRDYMLRGDNLQLWYDGWIAS